MRCPNPKCSGSGYHKRMIATNVVECRHCGTWYNPRTGKIIKPSENNDGKKEVVTP